MIIFYCFQLYNAMGVSLIISLQHNNEIYKHIKLSHLSYKIISMSTRNVTFTRVCITVLFTTNSFLLLLNLLILCGDIHPNPGPASVGPLNDSSLSSTASIKMVYISTPNNPPPSKKKKKKYVYIYISPLLLSVCLFCYI